MGVYTLKTGVPSEYQEVDYISNGVSSTSYLEFTNIKIADISTSKVEIKTNVSFGYNGSNAGEFVGIGNRNTPSGFGLGLTQNTTLRMRRRIDSSHWYYTNLESSSTLSLDTRYDIDATWQTPTVKGFQCYIDGVEEINNTTAFGDLEYQLSGTPYLRLFMLNASNLTNVGVKVYSLQVYVDDVLMLDGHPCYRKSDNTIGMYDSVTDVFYITPAGTLLKGSDISGVTQTEEQPVLMNRLLPSKYQKVENITSSKTQYIDTGITPTNNTKLEIKANWLTPSGSSTNDELFGAREGSTYFELLAQANRSYYQWGTVSGTISISDTNGLYTWLADKNTLYRDGSQISSVTSTTFSINNNLFLMGLNNNGSFERGANATVYYCKIWENGTLVRDFVPCYRKSDNVVGLYDKVNDVFYTNAATTGNDFTKGNDVSSIVTEEVDFALLKPIIPSEYQQVEYLESTGEQYINTGITNITTTDGYKLTTALTTSSADASAQVFGSDNGNYYFDINLRHPNLQSVVEMAWGIGNTVTSQSPLNVGQFYTLELNSNGNCYIDDVLQGTVTKTLNVSILSLGLFCRIKASTIRYSKTKISSFIYYRDGTELRNLIPCYRKSDNVAGMYDKVNDVFYTNAGSGSDFAKGNDKTVCDIIYI